jgi:hypothetical protein
MVGGQIYLAMTDENPMSRQWRGYWQRSENISGHKI